MGLPKQIKLIGVGSFILAISTLLPWYADLDSYKIGDKFLGVTGPASFVGIIILLLSGLSFALFAYRLMGRRLPHLPVREAIVHLATSIESLFLLLVVNSIYFHPKFGVNITLKESGFGMILAVVGSAILLAGAYLKNRDEISEEKGGETGKLEPLIAVPEKEKISPISAQASSSTKGFVFGERKQVALDRIRAQEKIENCIASKTEVHVPITREDTSEKGSNMIRLDL